MSIWNWEWPFFAFDIDINLRQDIPKMCFASPQIICLLISWYIKYKEWLCKGFTPIPIYFVLTAPFQLLFFPSSLAHPSIPFLHCPPLPNHSSHTHSQCEYVVIRLSQRQASHHCIRMWLPLVGSVWLPSLLLRIPCTLNFAPFISFPCATSKNN